MKTALLKVLVVDDDQFQLMAVSAWLKSVGAEVLTRNSPFGTSRDVLREQPDLLLLDLNMPGLDGATLLGMLGKHKEHTGVIFYSGQEQEALDRMVVEHGALGAISKKYKGQDFLRRFEDLSSKWKRRPTPAPRT